jgi:hypothetical protein
MLTRSFETESAGRRGEHEAVVDVNQMTMSIDQYIAVVTIFDLQ